MATTPRPAELLSALLDQGYTQTAGAVIAAMARDTERGPLADRLKQFEQRAQELADKGEAMSADDATLRALLADFGDALRKDAAHIDAVSPMLEDLGINAAGQFVRQTSLPGLSDQQLGAIGVQWNHPDPEAVHALVQFTQSDGWRAELAKYGDIETQARNIALRGMVAGQGPLTTARDLRDAIENIPAARANTLMRTLEIRSFQAATAAHQQANSDILETQIRIASLDDRCCLSCIALHGTEVPLGEPIDDHENGRCVGVAVLKGQTLNIQSGEDWFNSLDEGEQRQHAGAGALELLLSGKATLQDFVHEYDDDLWGQMIREATLEMVRRKIG